MPTVHIKDIIKIVKRYGCREALISIGQLAAELHDQKRRFKQVTWVDSVGGYPTKKNIVVATHLLAALARVVLAHGNRYQNTVMSERQIHFLQNQIDYLPREFTKVPIQDASLDQLLFQMSHQQFHFQDGNE